MCAVYFPSPATRPPSATSASAVLALMALAGRDGALSVDQALGVATLMVDNGELRQLIGGYGNWAEKTPAERLQVFEDFVRTLTFAEQSGNNEQQGILKTMIRNMNEGERGAMANSMDDYQRNGW